MNYELLSPNIHLFAFYQKEQAIAGGSNSTASWLWSKCDEIILKILGKKINLEHLLDFEQHQDITHTPLVSSFQEVEQERPYLELINPENSIFDNSYSYSYIDDGKIYFEADNFVYAVRSYDSFGLGISLRNFQSENLGKLSSDNLSSLNPSNSFIFDEDDKFLGQTLLITISLPSLIKHQTTESLKKIADDYLHAFFPDTYRIPPFNRAGNLFDSPIFEYGIFRQLSTYRHILVWFISDEEKFNKCYKAFFDLFCFRAEVVNAYEKSCNYYRKLTARKYQEIEHLINKILKLGQNTGLIQTELKEFNYQIVTLLKMSLEYAHRLRDIEVNQNRIVVKNRYYIEKLREINSIFPQEEISFLENFSENTSRYFQEQVAMELDYFRHGFGLIDKAIASIRGQVAIDLAEAERRRARKEQRNNLAIVSGFSTASFVASAWQIEGKGKRFAEILQSNPFAVSISLGFIVGTLVWLISWLISLLRYKFQEKLIVKENTRLKK